MPRDPRGRPAFDPWIARAVEQVQRERMIAYALMLWRCHRMHQAYHKRSKARRHRG